MNHYTITLAASAVRDLGKLPEKVAAAIMAFLMGPLAENPQRVGKQLMGDYDGFYSARRGAYRVIYRIIEQIVEVDVVRLRYRKDVYRPA